MLSQPDGPFINFARLNISKYASKPNIAKHLFEYAYFHDNDIRQVCNVLFLILDKKLFLKHMYLIEGLWCRIR